jgi:hypothetical protein
MKIPLIELRSRQTGGSENFYQRVLDQLNASMPVFIPCDSYIEVQHLITQFIGRDFPCTIKLSWRTNLSNIDYSNQEAIDDGWELHQDEKWGIYARKLSGLSLIPTI